PRANMTEALGLAALILKGVASTADRLRFVELRIAYIDWVSKGGFAVYVGDAEWEDLKAAERLVLPDESVGPEPTGEYQLTGTVPVIVTVDLDERRVVR